MTRLALILAAAVLGTGCYVSDCNTRDLTVSWQPGFDGPDALAGRSCAAAGVSYVDVFIDDQQVVGPLAAGHFDCRDLAVTIAAVPRGSHTVTVEGVAVGGTIKYRDDRTVGTNGCGTLGVGVAPSAGFVNLAYQFFDGPTQLPQAGQVCAPGSFLWLSIFDQIANQRAVLSDVGASPTAYSCGGPFALPLPAGAYVLQWMEERGPSPTFALESSDCTDRAFSIAAANTTDVPIDLNVTAPASCVR